MFPNGTENQNTHTIHNENEIRQMNLNETFLNEIVLFRHFSALPNDREK